MSVEPPVVNFEFTSLNETIHAVVKLNNISAKALRVLILPQLSKYFNVDTNDKSHLLPGFPLTLNVHFTPDELRHYSDWLRIICSVADCNLMVPLYAVPANHYDFPKKINLGTTSLGDMVSGNFSIPSSIDTDIEFLIFLPEPSIDFCVRPLAGLIKQNDAATNVLIKFRPTRYITVMFPIQLYIPCLATSPFTIYVIADCKPCLAREKLLLEATAASAKMPEILKRNESSHVRFKPHSKLDQMEDPVEELRNLNTSHGVVKFLLAKEQPKPSPSEVLGPLGRFMNEDKEIYKAKEKLFRQAIIKFDAENRAAMFHQRDKLGVPLDVSVEVMERVLAERSADQEEFKHLLATESPEQVIRPRRAIRNYDDLPDTNFTDDPSDMWFVKYQALCKFIQAARYVIINNRLCRRLEVLKNAREFIECDLQRQEAEISEVLVEKQPEEEEKEMERRESAGKEKKEEEQEKKKSKKK